MARSTWCTTGRSTRSATERRRAQLAGHPSVVELHRERVRLCLVREGCENREPGLGCVFQRAQRPRAKGQPRQDLGRLDRPRAGVQVEELADEAVDEADGERLALRT